jgi:cyanophycinase-like exopeptidase
MKKNIIWYALGAVAVFYILKKKRIIGESVKNAAEQMTAEEVNNLDFKIDYRTFADMYREQEKS